MAHFCRALTHRNERLEAIRVFRYSLVADLWQSGCHDWLHRIKPNKG